MKRKNAVMLGNVFMGIGMVLMVGGSPSPLSANYLS